MYPALELSAAPRTVQSVATHCLKPFASDRGNMVSNTEVVEREGQTRQDGRTDMGSGLNSYSHGPVVKSEP